MGKALYRKYRSRSLSEIVGQDHITTTLGNALQAGKISHAYLLTGPRGVGKTSVARILAHEINGLPYSEEPHLDIIEIDAASNNGVEDVRDLRDKILSDPTSAKYKVFIIDEVHMLSKAAFNALLKTLEEPPAHVVFILATTESHKLPETVVSRTQRYSFRPVPLDRVIRHLKTIADKEHITIDDDALALIATHGEGSFRDSISLLDQASSVSKHVTLQHVEQLLGRAPSEEVDRLLAAITEHEPSRALVALQSLTEYGYEPTMIALQLSQRIRGDLLTQHDAAIPAHAGLELLRELLDVPPSHNPRVMLEITILKACTEDEPATMNRNEAQPATPVAPKQAIPSLDVPAPKPQHSREPSSKRAADDTAELADPATEQTPLPPVVSKNTEKPSGATATVSAVREDDEALWQAVLERLKQSHNTLYGTARMARPHFNDDVLTLSFSFAFHQKRLSEPKNRAIIAQLLEDLRGRPTKVQCIVDTQPNTKSAVRTDFSNISNIFGGAELLES